MPRRIKPEEFASKIQKDFSGSLTLLETYVRSSDRIRVRCEIHDHEFRPISDSLLRGHGCPKCGDSFKKTHEEFVDELCKINPDVTVVGTYNGVGRNIEFSCKKCDHKWKTTPNGLLCGSGCRKCAGSLKKTTEQYCQEVNDLNLPVEILGEYVGNKVKVRTKCLVCGYDEWLISPNALLKKLRDHQRYNGCPECSSKGFKQRLPSQFYVYDLIDGIGFGITNVPANRHIDHRRNIRKHNIEPRLIFCAYGSGYDVFKMEGVLVKRFSMRSKISGFRKETMSVEDWNYVKSIFDSSETLKEAIERLIKD